MEHYNRVLIINSQSMFKNNATGITLRSLWENWPNDKLLEIYNEPILNDVVYSYKFEDNFFQRIIHLVKEIHKRRVRKFEVKIKNHESRSSVSSVSKNLKLLLNCLNIKVTRKDWERIREFNPDIVYTLGGSVNVLALTNKIAKKLNIPIAVHYMDNWPNKVQSGNTSAEKIYHKILIRNLNKNLKRSEICFTISPYMTEEYNKKFHMRHVSLMNCVDVGVLSDINDNKTTNQDLIKIVYAGGLHLNRWKKLKLFAEFMLKEGFNTRMFMYISDKDKLLYEDEFPKENCDFMKMISHDSISEIYKNADILIHVEADDEENIPFIKYSISTKIPECLAVGRPFIFYGPSDIAMYRYLKENNIAYAVCNNEELKTVMTEVLHDVKSGKYKYRENAIKFAQDNHSYGQVREKLRKSLEDIVESFRETSNQTS